MPRGDGTGPNGMGAMSGRAAGYCAGYNVPGFANVQGGRGLGRGGGRGMAWRRGWGGGVPQAAAAGYGVVPQPAAAYGWGLPRPAAPAAPLEPRAVLEQQMASLQAQLAYVQERLQALTEETPKEEE